jgi:hypothetical protein
MGSLIRTHVPFSDAPVTMPLNCCPMRLMSNSADAALRTWRSTFVAFFSCTVQ